MIRRVTISLTQSGLLLVQELALERVAEHDPALKLMADRLADAGYLLSDVATDLAAYADDIESDPSRLAAAQERQSVLAGLVRKYATAGAGVDAVIVWAADAGLRLAELDNDDSRLAELAIESGRLRESMVRLRC